MVVFYVKPSGIATCARPIQRRISPVYCLAPELNGLLRPNTRYIFETKRNLAWSTVSFRSHHWGGPAGDSCSLRRAAQLALHPGAQPASLNISQSLGRTNIEVQAFSLAHSLIEKTVVWKSIVRRLPADTTRVSLIWRAAMGRALSAILASE
ncbi:hypothetical protein FA15DRAFT_338463 [Coprinopsis marcescibilis]|uniref:Uncharacterized protein n=1 Tax=Coprinopsis marcescibilis TaxID=230819 RepID=A0A5C3KBG6_COPMA|nr:hypothetical protein FA15DRAFT_338463 [Coprinopsis marcescibilis]